MELPEGFQGLGWQVSGLPGTVLSSELSEGSVDLGKFLDMGSGEVTESQPLVDLSRAGGWQGHGDARQFVFSRWDSLGRKLKSQIGHLRAAKDILVQIYLNPVSRQSSQNLVQKIKVFQEIG